MIYIELDQPYQTYDKVKISAVYFIKETTSDRLSFKYDVCKKDGLDYITLFTKDISITDQSIINNIALIPSDSQLSIWDNIAKKLLQYIVDSDIESGIIEKE